MATTADSIVSASKTIAANVLGATWKELKFVFDIAENNERTGANGYGVRPLEASNAATVTGSYMLDHRFELILTKTFARREGDTEIFTVLSSLYDYMDQIYRQFESLKLNLGTTIALVTSPSLSEPEVLTTTGLVVLRMQYLVKYRNTLS